MIAGTVSEITGSSVEEIRKAYMARLSEMDKEMKEVREHLEKNFMIFYGSKKIRTEGIQRGEFESGGSIHNMMALMQ